MASPTDLIKTQIQMEGRRRLLGYQPRVEGAADALRFSSQCARLDLVLSTRFYLRKIVAQGGILGLWRGCWPNVQVVVDILLLLLLLTTVLFPFSSC